MYKQDLSLNNFQGLISDKTQPKQLVDKMIYLYNRFY